MFPSPRPAPALSVRPDTTQGWIAVDSDGCVLDTMEPKHRLCFTPALIECWELRPIAALASHGFLQINLHSKFRGVNRFTALDIFWQWLDCQAAGGLRELGVPPLERFNAWVRRGCPLSETTLAAEIARFPGDAALERSLRWSRRVNELALSLPTARPFPGVPGALAAAATTGPLHVVSGGNGPAILDEWHTTGLHCLVCEFHTQEAGSKESILARLAAESSRGLMIGDSPGDADAARAAGVLFFPIIPGREEESWQSFHQEILPTFRAGRYTAAQADAWTAVFRAALGQPSAESAALS